MQVASVACGDLGLDGAAIGVYNGDDGLSRHAGQLGLVGNYNQRHCSLCLDGDIVPCSTASFCAYDLVYSRIAPHWNLLQCKADSIQCGAALDALFAPSFCSFMLSLVQLRHSLPIHLFLPSLPMLMEY